MAEKGDLAFAPLTSSIVKGLNDKLYDKRKAATLDIEKMVKQFVINDDKAKIVAMTGVLRKEFVFSTNANSRKGGLIGLAAAVIALGPEYLLQNFREFLPEFVPPILQCFTDTDSRVRYYACEALYNISKVARGHILLFFNRIFDSLSKLACDPDAGVKSGAELLDRLIKDIVTENPVFDIPKFIDLLKERIYTVNPYTRQFMVSWLTVLNSVPDIELLGYLPDFLNGLFKMLGDPSPEMRGHCEVYFYIYFSLFIIKFPNFQLLLLGKK